MKRALRARRTSSGGQAVVGRLKLAKPSPKENDLNQMLGEIVDAAISIVGSECACIQLLHPASSTLRIAALRGFPPWWIDFWKEIPSGRFSSGGSLERREPVIVEDLEKSSIFSGKLRKICARAGVRAVQLTPIVSRSGEPLGLLSTFNKTTHRPDKSTLRLLDLLARYAADSIGSVQAKAALRANEERYKRMLDTEVIAVLFWDDTGTLVEANDTFLRMTGYSRAEVQRRELTWRRLTPPEWIESSEHQMQKLAATGHIGPYDKEYFLKDGSRRWMSFVGQDLGDGTIVEYCVDITDRKRMEEALERQGRRKDEFLSLLGHELRNPLTTISFATDLLRLESAAERRDSLEETITHQVALLQRLVDDLLDLARVAHGQISLKTARIDLADFLQRVAGSARSFFAERRQKLVLRSPAGRVSFAADGMRLEQMVMNLLHNASKYADLRGRIELSGALDSGSIVIRCKDNGRGIPADLQKTIFEPFVRGPQPRDTHGHAGLGIGLALVRQLVELHGGTISVRSGGPGMGSEFVVKLPAVKASTAARAGSKSPSALGARRRLFIVIVEDDPDVAHTLRIGLEQAGHRVISFPDGFSALAKVSSLRPDAALIDIGLPGMDGYELVARLRKKRNLQHTVCIAVSGFMKRPEAGSDRGNFDHYLVKPLSLSGLLTLLDRIPRPARLAAARSATV